MSFANRRASRDVRSKVIHKAVRYECERLEGRLLLSSGINGGTTTGNTPYNIQGGTSTSYGYDTYYNAYLFETRDTGFPDVSSCPVRFLDGLPKFDTTDFMSNAFGRPFGHVRTWAARDGVNSDINGFNWGVEDVPRMLQKYWPGATNPYTVVVIDTGLVQRWFDYNPNADSYAPRLDVKDALKHVDPDGTPDNNSYFRLEGADGTVMRFHDFNYSNAFLAGRLIDETYPGGLLVTASYYPATAPPESQNQLQTITRTDGSLSEQFNYFYTPSNDGNSIDPSRVSRVEWRQNGTLVRQAVYDYYGTNDPSGNVGALRQETTQDASGNELNKDFYRYWLSDSAPGHTNGLKYVSEGPSLARLRHDMPDYLTAADADVAPYADHYFEYQCWTDPVENIIRFRISKEVVPGQSGTPTGSGLDTNDYEYADNPNFTYNVNNVQYNTWFRRISETMPDPTPGDAQDAITPDWDNPRKITYVNQVGDAMLTAYTVPDPATNAPISRVTFTGSAPLWTGTVTTANQHNFHTGDRILLVGMPNTGWTTAGQDNVYPITVTGTNTFTFPIVSVNPGGPSPITGLNQATAVKVSQSIDFYKYDTHGQVLMHAHPSAVTGYDETLAAGDLLNQSGNTYQYLSNNTGKIELNDYYASGWQFGGSGAVTPGGGGISANGTTTSAIGGPNTQYGSQAAYLLPGGTLTQSLAGWAGGTNNYTLTFYAAQAITGSSQTLQVLLDGTPLMTVTPPSSTSYTQYTTSTFQVSAGSHTIQFVATGSSGTVLIDNFSISGTGAPSIDDPSFESPTLTFGTYTANPLGSTGTASSAGGVNTYLQDQKVEQGQLGTANAAVLKQMAYDSQGDSHGAVVYPAGTQTVYRAAPSSGAEVTTYTYTFYPGSTQVLSQTTTLPTVTTNENGPGTAVSTTQYYDSFGKPTFQQDGDGYVSYTAHDPGSGASLKTIKDADTTSKQTDLYTVGGTVANTTFTLTVRTPDATKNKAVSYSASGSDTPGSVATALANAWNGANVPLTNAVTATVQGNSVQLQANWAGVQFYVTPSTSGTGSGTLTGTSTPSDFAAASASGEVPPSLQSEQYAPGNVSVGATFTLTAAYGDGSTPASVSYTAVAGDTALSVAGNLASAWNTSTNSLMTGVTAVVLSNGAVALVGKTPGVPFYVTPSAGGGGTLIRSTISSYLATAVPPGLTSPSGTRLRLISTMQVDALGRTTKLVDPNGNTTYTVYNDQTHDVRTYPGWNSATNMPTGPTQDVRQDWADKYNETLTMTATPHTTGGVPDGAEAVSGIQSLRRDHINDSGRVVFSDRYFSVSGLTYAPGEDLGTAAANYHRTEVEYADHDQHISRMVAPTNTITETLYDGMERPTSTWVGTSDIFVKRFDFGPANTPVRDGYIQTGTAGYSAPPGYGWNSGTLGTGNNSTGNYLTQDYVSTTNGTFQVDVPAAGNYLVTVLLVNPGSGSNTQNVAINGTSLPLVTTNTGDVKTVSVVVTVPSGGPFNIQVNISAPYTGQTAAIAGLEIQTAQWSSATSGSNLVKVKQNQYDDGGVNDNNLTAVATYPGETANSTPSATFVGTDSTSQGNWKGNVGFDGELIDSHATTPPSYAGVTYTNVSDLLWAADSTDARALQRLDRGDGIASAFVPSGTNTSFSIGLNLTDNLLHRVAFYFVDWDTSLRAETITVKNTGTGATLDTRSISSFNAGTWLVWNLQGNVTIQVAATGTGSAVLSGIFFDPANARVTRDYYDWRDRLVAAKGASQGATGESTSLGRPIQYLELDNLGEITARTQYDGDGIRITDADADGTPDAPATGVRRARTQYSYDEQQRLYQTTVFSVDPSSGNLGSTLVTNTFYDKRADMIEEADPGGLVYKYQYDGSRRDSQDSVSDGGVLGGASQDWTHALNTVSDVVLSQTLKTYDNNGNLILVIEKQRFDNDASTGTGDLGGPGTSPNARVSYTAKWYDAANRLTDSANFGTNDSVVLYQNPSMPPSLPPAKNIVSQATGTGSTTTLVDANRTEPNNYFVGYKLTITAGAGVGGSATVTGFSAGTFTVSSSLGATTNSTSVYSLIPAPITGTASGGTTSTLVDSHLTQPSNMFIGWMLNITGGTYNVGTMVAITGYNAATSTLTFAPALTSGHPIDGTSQYALIQPALLTHADYDAAGRGYRTIDPRGIATVNSYDLLNRVTQTVQAWDGNNPSTNADQTTTYTYDGDNHVLTMTAVEPTGTPSQTTQYVYGVGGGNNNIFSNDLIATVEYPTKTGANAGQPSTAATDDQSYSYDTLGEKTYLTDQNQTTHQYLYDLLGRLTADIINTVGSGVNGVVRRLGYSFDSASRPFQQTTYSNTGGTTILNQVEDLYNGYGQLITEYQAHTSAVNMSTSPKVQYTYSQPTGANYSRLTSLTYPNARVLNYLYGGTEAVTSISSAGTTATVTTASPHGLASGNQVTIQGASPAAFDGTFTITVTDATHFTYTFAGNNNQPASGTDMIAVAVPTTTPTLDGTISRVSGLSDAAGTYAGIVLESYLYLGLGTIAQRYRQNRINLTYINQGSGDPNPPPTTIASAGDRYTGLDRFGRVADQFWLNPNTISPTDRFQYGYDQDGNALSKNNIVSSPNSELYHANSTASGDNNSAYDPLNRLANFSRGSLSASHNNDNTAAPLDTASGATAASNWSLDALGNWNSLTTPAKLTQSQTLGTAQNTATTGWYGEKITTGASAVTVTQLGRWFLAGSTGTHQMKLVDASTGNDVPGTTVTVSMTGTTAGFYYAPLSQRVTLLANHSYYLVSYETNSGDQWYDNTTTVTTSSVATGNGWASNTGSWSTGGSSGQTYGPVDLMSMQATTRQHDSRNEVTQVGSAVPTFDNNGNTTKDETGKTYTYDAWNRMVTTSAGGGEVFAYDADNRRPSLTICTNTITDSYYSTDWQVLEEDNRPVSGAATVNSQYVWGLGYVDDLVLRDDNSTSGSLGKNSSGLGRRLFAQQDANWNVTAITDVNGNVQERFIYDPYGSVTFLNPSTWLSKSDTFSWNYLFQGGRYDSNSKLYNFRHRDYSPTLGRWMQQDPLGYVNGLGLYQFVGSNPIIRLDPKGTEFGDIAVAAGIGGILGGIEGGIVGSFQGKTGLELLAAIGGGAVSGLILGAGGAAFAVGSSLGTAILGSSFFGAIGNGIGNVITQSGTGEFNGKELVLSALLGAIGGAIAGPFNSWAGKLAENPGALADFMTQLGPNFEKALVRLGWTGEQASNAAAAVLQFLGSHRRAFSVFVDGLGDEFAHFFEGAGEVGSSCQS